MITESLDEAQTTLFGIVGERFLSLPKMLRVTTCVQRFIMKLRKIATPEGAISAEEMVRARMTWIKYLQDKHYLQVVNGEATIKKKVSKNQLNPKLDTDGIVRCYGRLRNANLSEETVTPVRPPRREGFVSLFIEDF